MTRSRSPAPTAHAVAGGSMAMLLFIGGCGERQGPSPASTPPSPAPAAAASPAPAAPASTPSPTAAGATAAPAAAAGSTWTLMVTWMSPQAPPTTSQTVFHDGGACDRARAAALAEGARLQADAQAAFTAAHAKFESGERHYVGRTLLGGDTEPAAQAPPTVAAFCAAS